MQNKSLGFGRRILVGLQGYGLMLAS